MSAADWTRCILVGAGATSLAAVVAVVSLLRAIHRSVGLAPPTEAQLAEEDMDASAVFRAMPELKGKVAFRQLGEFPTPIHWGSMPAGAGGGSDGAVCFMVKREDLASPLYGGNKVRTMQHQLAVCEARAEHGTCQRMVVTGTGGSNQMVAATVHGSRYPRVPKVSAMWFDEDLPELDNSLNMLSVLSFPLAGWATWGWGGGMGVMVAAVGRALWTGNSIIQLPGGNSPAGVLGQVGGALELAEQIVAGRANGTDVDVIYLPVGSSCTISGLVIGVAFARDVLKMPVFQHPGFEIVGVPIHHALAAAQRLVGFSTARWASMMPLTLQHTVRSTCAAIAAAGGPSLEAAALKVLEQQVRLEADSEVVGTYGGHSALSRATADAFEAHGTVCTTGPNGREEQEATPLWLCGHFCAKAFHVMLREQRREAAAQPAAVPRRALFWQTKSAVQPLLGGQDGGQDELERLKAMPAAVRRWAEKGEATSGLRPGKIDSGPSGKPADYRSVMVQVKTR